MLLSKLDLQLGSSHAADSPYGEIVFELEALEPDTLQGILREAIDSGCQYQLIVHRKMPVRIAGVGIHAHHQKRQ